MLRVLAKKALRSLRRRGLVGTVRTGVKAVAHRIIELTPARRRLRARERAEEAEFDRHFGVDTSGIIDLDRLGVDHASIDFASRYQPIWRLQFDQVLKGANINYREYLFIDYGSGKGRALLMASDLPFKKIVGVEFARDLHDIAERNVAAYRSERQRCRAFQLVCADAATYDLPEDPAVLFFYNPFAREVMSRVIENIGRSFSSRPRDIIVLYFTRELAGLWDAERFLSREYESPKDGYMIYRSILD